MGSTDPTAVSDSSTKHRLFYPNTTKYNMNKKVLELGQTKSFGAWTMELHKPVISQIIKLLWAVLPLQVGHTSISALYTKQNDRYRAPSGKSM